MKNAFNSCIESVFFVYFYYIIYKSNFHCSIIIYN